MATLGWEARAGLSDTLESEGQRGPWLQDRAMPRGQRTEPVQTSGGWINLEISYRSSDEIHVGTEQREGHGEDGGDPRSLSEETSLTQT